MGNFSREVEYVLHMLAERFGTTVDALWSVLLKQSYISAGGYLLTVFVCVIFFTIFVKATKMAWHESFRIEKEVAEHRSYAGNKQAILYKTFINTLDSDFVVPMGIVVALPSLVLGFFCLYRAIARFVNPEFYALQLIIEMIWK